MKNRLLPFYLAAAILITSISSVASSSEFMTIQQEDESYSKVKCDIVLPSGLCSYGGQTVILPDAKPKGLVGHWSFDDSQGLDSSGHHLHVEGKVKPGPGFGGTGYSAVIGSGNFMVIPGSLMLDSKELSISFWLFLNEGLESGSGARNCPLIYKGAEVRSQNEKARAPALFINKKSRKLTAYFTTTSNGTKSDGEYVESNGRVALQRWNHITLVRYDKKIYLYLNGILDNIIVTEGSTVSNSAPLLVGNSPDYIEECDVKGYIDELRYYNRVLTENEIIAEAGPSTGNVNADYVLLGCLDCPANEAVQSCIAGYHLCTTIELHSAGYQIGKAMGWIKWNSNIWSFQSVKGAASEIIGTGLCCIN